MRSAVAPAGRPVEELTRDRSSPVLRFLARLLTLVVALLVWLLVLIASALALLLHLMVMALARGTEATLSAVLSGEAAAKDDVSSTFARLSGRTAEAETPLPSHRPAA